MLVRTSSNERTSGLSRYCSTNPIMVSAHTRNCSTTDESVSTTYCRKEPSVASRVSVTSAAKDSARSWSTPDVLEEITTSQIDNSKQCLYFALRNPGLQPEHAPRRAIDRSKRAR